MKDFLIVGLGLAGGNFVLKLLQNNKTFHVIDAQSQSASRVAAGVYNPVVLKRFNVVWRVREQIKLLTETQNFAAQTFGTNTQITYPIYRIFHDEEEQKTWQTKRIEQPALEYFLAKDIVKNTEESINASYDFGNVQHGGRIDVPQFLNSVKKHIQSKYEHAKFDYKKLKKLNHYWEYEDQKYQNIVFCEGVQVKHNPYFCDLPIRPNKGEILHVKLSDRPADAIYKGRVFLMPMEDNKFYVGATYDRKFETIEPTDKELSYLKKQVEKIYTKPYNIVKHKAGLRATVPDRRPLIGEHKEHENMFVLNGMGSHGTLNGPYATNILYNYIYHNTEIPAEVNIERYQR